jgi:hypothetical protein
MWKESRFPDTEEATGIRLRPSTVTRYNRSQVYYEPSHEGGTMREVFYATAATVIPVFFLAHTVLRDTAAGLLRHLRDVSCLIVICLCVLVPLVGELAALMALSVRPGPDTMTLTWIGLIWTGVTFAWISIMSLWKMMPHARESPLSGVPGIPNPDLPLCGLVRSR